MLANAYDAKIDGIYYNFSGGEATVTYGGEYSGTVVIPSSVYYYGTTYSVTSIGDYAFSGCSSLTSVTIPNSVTSIGEGAFYLCSGLTSVTIPESVTSIGYEAFYYCSGLTSVTIPNSVTSIGYEAFYYCSGLTSVNIGNSVTSIGSSAFYGCSRLTSIVVESGNTKYDSRNNCNAIIETATNTLIAGCKNTIIPNSVTSIGSAAFYNCWRLTSVIIPNSVINIGGLAFYGCSSLTSVTSPNSVTSIGGCAFEGCRGLTSVTIGNSVTSIGEGAFADCSGLTSITIPNNVTSISNYAFSGCTGLTSVTIGDSVTSIGNYAFFGCTSLTSVTIPNSVTSIGSYAFRECSGLTDVWCYAEKVPSTNSYAFEDSPIASATLHVPASSVNSYKNTSPWSRFGTIVAIQKTTYTLTYIVDGEVYKTYEVEEGEAITPEPAPIKEGYTFSGWSYIPPTMPATDVVVMGSFKINTYTLTYEVDGEKYKTYNVEYNAAITPEPEPTKAGYTFSGWSEIPETMPAHDVTVTGSFTKDKLGKCATPTISYVDGEVTFNSETEGVTFIYDTDIEDEDITGGIGNKIQFSVTYHISVYAQKEDYYDSEVATATLCWIDVEPRTEGIVNEDAVTEVKALPVLIQTQGGNITIQGAAEGTPIAVYDTSGKQYGSALSEKDCTTISTTLQPGTIAIVKIGEKSLKIVMRE